MMFRRVIILVAILVPPLMGCAQNLDLGILYAAPGKYDYLRCEDLPARLAKSLTREKELSDLMTRANQEAGGAVVNVVAYSADLAQVRADIKILRQAAIDKNCGNIEPAVAPVPATPAGRASKR
jgi:xanthine dehydrogenase molybdopterin-binding subunit B